MAVCREVATRLNSVFVLVQCCLVGVCCGTNLLRQLQNWSLVCDSICYSVLYAIARPSVRLSVTRMDQSKTVEVRIMQLMQKVW